jgi:hypothetical protein
MTVVEFELRGNEMLLEADLGLLSKRGLETNFSLVFSCAVDEPIDRFVLPRAPANGDEDNAVCTGLVHISEERLQACYAVSPTPQSVMQLGGAPAHESAMRGNVLFESNMWTLK